MAWERGFRQTRSGPFKWKQALAGEATAGGQAGPAPRLALAAPSPLLLSPRPPEASLHARPPAALSAPSASCWEALGWARWLADSPPGAQPRAPLDGQGQGQGGGWGAGAAGRPGCRALAARGSWLDTRQRDRHRPPRRGYMRSRRWPGLGTCARPRGPHARPTFRGGVLSQGAEHPLSEHLADPWGCGGGRAEGLPDFLTRWLPGTPGGLAPAA